MIKIQAAGRVCLFGDHQDYLGLPIIACAIDKHIRLHAVENNTDHFKIDFQDLNETLNISLPINFDTYDPKDTFMAVLKVLQKYGCSANKGYDLSITGTIPINAGLSSSSALVLVWVGFLVKAFGTSTPMNQEKIAQIAYEAEVLERHGPGGKMDQYSIALGNILYLETGIDTRYKSFKKDLPGLVIGESGIAKDTLGLLADRRRLAMEALEFLQNAVADFRIDKITLADIDTHLALLPHTLKPYFNAAVQNHLITQKALLEFERNTPNVKAIGTLMSAHHEMLKNELQITVPRIDDMIDAALKAGAYGAKIVGSGGGGCIVALAAKEKEKQIISALKSAGAVNAYATSVAEGIQL